MSEQPECPNCHGALLYGAVSWRDFEENEGFGTWSCVPCVKSGQQGIFGVDEAGMLKPIEPLPEEGFD